jgi:hypothetical protein
MLLLYPLYVLLFLIWIHGVVLDLDRGVCVHCAGSWQTALQFPDDGGEISPDILELGVRQRYTGGVTTIRVPYLTYSINICGNRSI